MCPLGWYLTPPAAVIGSECVVVTCVGPIRALPCDFLPPPGEAGEGVCFIFEEAELKGGSVEVKVETRVRPGAEEERRAGLSVARKPSFLHFSELDWLTSSEKPFICMAY